MVSGFLVVRWELVWRWGYVITWVFHFEGYGSETDGQWMFGFWIGIGVMEESLS